MTVINRRNVLLQGLFGASLLGLRSLASGIPAAILANPRTARAEEDQQCADKSKAQYLILSTSASGDPLNANVPGTYDHPEIAHSPDPTMVKTVMTLGGKATSAAKPWATLPAAVLARTSFFHHTTLTSGHGNEQKVLALMGGTNREEMFISSFAKYLAPCLGTVQRQPISLGAASTGEVLRFDGRSLPALTPSGLKGTLLNAPGPLTNLQKLRDDDLNRLNALYKESGSSVQRHYLDRFARSQNEARNISQQLLDNLTAITNNDQNNQMLAAAILIKMNVAPAFSVHLGFGGDNHTDPNLAGEARQTVASVDSITRLLAKLTEFGLQDKVTFAAMNVFGRTLVLNKTNGRDHLGNHHATVMIGKNVRGSVIGGLVKNEAGTDFKAMPIDSKSGAGSASGDISFNDTLSSVGKTLGAALGVPRDVIDTEITTGKVVEPAVA
jgi:hypothetical protein